jgi:predicted phage gp36 major capsid-like protein
LKEKAKRLPIWEGEFWIDRYNMKKTYTNAEVSRMIEDFKEDAEREIEKVRSDLRDAIKTNASTMLATIEKLRNENSELKQKLQQFLSEEYPENWSLLAIAQTRLRKISELLKEV